MKFMAGQGEKRVGGKSEWLGVCSFNKRLLSVYCVSDTALGSGGNEVNKTKISAFME